MHRKAPEFHIPVLGPAVSQRLISDPKGLYVDATLGGGGHAEILLDKLDAEGQIIGIDRDPEALEAAQRRLMHFGYRIQFIQAPFWQLADVLTQRGVEKISGILFDLGVSSHQIDAHNRGFSFQQDGPLDMRMGPDAGLTAAEVVNTYSQNDLTRIFRIYGEERAAKRIAQAICQKRIEEPLQTTRDLTNVIDRCVRGPHTQKTLARVFQAIRIEVNSELAHLEHALQCAVGFLQPGGHIAVLSYHSLEHRIVKQVYESASKDCIGPRQMPFCPCERHAMLRLHKPRSIRPEVSEITANPRARSAALRMAERLDTPIQPWRCLQEEKP